MLRQLQRALDSPLFAKYKSLLRKDLAATYSRDLHKWIIVAPVIGVTVGLVTTGIAVVILDKMWPPLLSAFLHHPGTIIPVLVTAFLITGLLMQFFTSDPDEHSTEEVIRSYHQRQGRIDMRSFVPKLLAAITTVGAGGSAALEGPSIYGGGAIGSWLWARFRRAGMRPSERRIMLISGAAAGMAAVFRAPLTGLVFALEMPYQDDLAHEALVPSLIASVVSYATLISFMGSKPLFGFPVGSGGFTSEDLAWSAVLGALCGLAALVFGRLFQRFRSWMVGLSLPHWSKLAAGGLLTGVCGLIFISIYPGSLIPLGPNYEAVGDILSRPHTALSLALFGLLKLAATLFTLGVGGVSAMFVPLFLTGDAFGKAFALSIAHASSADLFAAVGMAAFIAGGYKTPLTAVVFVAEAAGGHAYIIPTLIGAAVAYAVSGEVSVSAEQRLHEGVRFGRLGHITARSVMQRKAVTFEPSATLQEFAQNLKARQDHTEFPVVTGQVPIGTISLWSLAKIDPQNWPQTRIHELVDRGAVQVAPDCDLQEVLRILMSSKRHRMVLVTDEEGKLNGVITKADVLNALILSTSDHAGSNNPESTTHLAARTQ